MRLADTLERVGVYYGWVIVLVGFVQIGLIFGIRLSFGLFFDTLTRSGEFGWTRADTAGVFSLTMIIFAMGSTLAGLALDRWGARRVFSIGLVIMAAGVALTSQMNSLLQFYLFYGVIAGAGITVLGLALQAATIARWFDRLGRRGLAIGLAFSGTGIGILVLAPILEQTISSAGWRAAYLFLAILLAGIALPLVAVFVRDRPEDLGLVPDGLDRHSVASPTGTPDRQKAATKGEPANFDSRNWRMSAAIRTGRFWLLMLAGAASLFTIRMITVHQVAHFVDSGVPRSTAAGVLGGTGLVTAFSFIIFGMMSDRIGRARTFYFGAMAQIAALYLLINISADMPRYMLYIYAFLWGIGEGSRSGLLTSIAGDLFSGPALGEIVGTLGGFFGVGAAIGSWLAGRIFDVSGSYVLAFQIALAATIVATLCIATISLQTRRSPEFRLA